MSALPFAIDASGAASPLYSHINESDVLPPVQRLSFAQYVQSQYSDPNQILIAYYVDALAAGVAVGVGLPEAPILDGAPQDAINPDTGKNDQRQGYYAEFKTDKDGLTLPTITFNSFREGGKSAYWSPRDLLWSEYQAHKDGEPKPPKFDPEEYKAKAAELAEISTRKRQEIARIDASGRTFVAKSASKAWEAAQPDTEHPYLTRKGIAAAGARVATSELKGALYDQAKGEIFPNGELCKKGELLIPIYNTGGELVNIQRINADGKKRFLKGGETKGCFYKMEGTEPALVAEGFADAATINKALGCAVYVAFSAYNLKHISESQLDIGAVAADDGEAGTKAAEATGLPYLAPPNPHGVSGYDWNDYGREHGLDAVREALSALVPVEREPVLQLANAWDLADNAKAAKFLIKGILEEDAHGILGGSTGTYKTFSALGITHSVTSGQPFLGHEVLKSGAVVYVCGEGQGGILRRMKALNLHTGTKPKHPAYILGQGVNLNCAESMAALEKVLIQAQPVLVIFDTFASLAGGIEENSNSEVSNALNLVRDTCRAAGASSLIVHHYGKDTDKGIRGASAFSANVDFAYGTKAVGNPDQMMATIECIKMKDGEHFKKLTIAHKVINLQLEDDPYATSLVTVAATDEQQAIVLDEGEDSPSLPLIDRVRAALVRVHRRQVGNLAAIGKRDENPYVVFMEWKREVDKLDAGNINLSRDAARLVKAGRIERLEDGVRGGEFRPIIEDDI